MFDEDQAFSASLMNDEGTGDFGDLTMKRAMKRRR
jgi:hypothetical protein